jgi:hypothetical protein
MTWTHPHSPTTKKSKLSRLQKKKEAMVSVYWYCDGLLLCEFLLPKPTSNGDKYCKTLKKLHKAIKQKRPG